MAEAPKNGPLTRQDLQALWESVVDPLYAQPFLEQPDSGFEAHGQVMEQLSRVSTAVERTTQSFYIDAWSGQSDLPASGSEFATVVLTFTRTKLVELPMVIGTEVPFEEVALDAGPNGPQEVRTGRRYRLVAALCMNPGEAGPFDVLARAELPGYGHANPMPGTISAVVQAGSNFSNDLATARPTQLVTANKPDVAIPQHVGQYVRVEAGLNNGRSFRVGGYGSPHPSLGQGGAFLLDSIACVRGTTSGTFQDGEPVLVRDAVTSAELGRGTLLRASGAGAYQFVTFRLEETAEFPAVNPTGHARSIEGLTSFASMDPIVEVVTPSSLLASTLTETWAVLSWVTDFGLAVSNAESPTGGRAAFLDALGNERKIRRALGEPDEQYRERVGQVADTVSPGAVVRAVNRILAPYGITACFREVGTPMLPGIYFDLDAYDYNFGIRPGDRFRLWLDYAYFRGFFMIGVPPLNWGEFGAAWDFGPHNAWDLTGAFGVAWDGHPYLAERLYAQVWQAVEHTRMGGVSWELYLERYGCELDLTPILPSFTIFDTA